MNDCKQIRFGQQPDWLREIKLPAESSPEDLLVLALDLAERNVVEGTGGPFGAVVYTLGSFAPFALGVNVVEPTGLSILHAEVAAICAAEVKTGCKSGLGAGYGLAISCAPCLMCLGAIHWSGVKRVDYAATSDDAQRIGFDEGPCLKSVQIGLKRNGIEFHHSLQHRQRGADILQRYISLGGKIY